MPGIAHHDYVAVRGRGASDVIASAESPSCANVSMYVCRCVNVRVSIGVRIRVRVYVAVRGHMTVRPRVCIHVRVRSVTVSIPISI